MREESCKVSKKTMIRKGNNAETENKSIPPKDLNITEVKLFSNKLDPYQ